MRLKTVTIVYVQTTNLLYMQKFLFTNLIDCSMLIVMLFCLHVVHLHNIHVLSLTITISKCYYGLSKISS